MPRLAITFGRLSRVVLPALLQAFLLAGRVAAADTSAEYNPLRMPGAGALSASRFVDLPSDIAFDAMRPVGEVERIARPAVSDDPPVYEMPAYEPPDATVAQRYPAWSASGWPMASAAPQPAAEGRAMPGDASPEIIPPAIDLAPVDYGGATIGAVPCPNRHTFQVLPPGLMYTSYLAGVREPRFASQWVSEATQGAFWDIALGGRVAVLRWGTADPVNPQGCEVQMEGAAFPRLARDYEMELIACDYRFGIPVAFARGRHRYKIGYYHLCSHLGDEWMLRYPELERINYVRDSMVVGYSFYATPDLRLYAEAGCAFGTDGGAEPWEFQFGIDYSPAQPTGLRPVPFMAVNGHLREEVDFGGNITAQVGWQWRGMTGNLLRMGLQCFVGKSEQFEFWNQYESKLGFGMWYDF